MTSLLEYKGAFDDVVEGSLAFQGPMDSFPFRTERG